MHALSQAGHVSTYSHVYKPKPQQEGMEQTLDAHRSLRPPMPMAQQQMDEFWRDRQKDIEVTEDFSEHAIPMARLKKIASSQKGNMMMTFDIPAFLSKMCELFVQELAIRAWACAQSHNRCIILDIDIAEVVASTESYDFLVDILHNHRAKHNSSPCSMLTMKRCRLVDQPSTSHLPHQYQLPQFAPTYTSAIPNNPNLMPPISQYRPFSFPSFMSTAPIVNRSILSIHNIARGLGLQENNINAIANNNVQENIVSTPNVLPSVMSPTLLAMGLGLQENNTNAVANNNVQDNIVGCSTPNVLGGVMSPTFLWSTRLPWDTQNSQSYMCMMDMINSIDAGGPSTSNNNVASEESLALPGHFNPTFLLQSPCSPFLLTNNNDTVVTIPEGVDIGDTMHVASDVVDATIMVLDGQNEQHEKETNVDGHCQNGVYGNVDAEAINVSTADGNKCSITWDELGMADDSLLDMFLDELQVRNDARIVLDKDLCLNDIIFSNPSTGNENN